MKLFIRRGRPRLGNGFRPAFVRYSQSRRQPVAEPKILSGIDLTGMTKTELKEYITSNGGSFTQSETKSELLVIAEGL